MLQKLFGDTNQRVLNKMRPLVEKINELEPKFERFSDLELKNKTEEFRERLGINQPSASSGDKYETLDDLLPEAFAAVREASKRTLGLRHFDAQLIGGVVLHQGKIAEMKTGEGKTLAATLAVYLNALESPPAGGVHVITVNDYLAKRDVNWMGPIYNALGMSVGCVVHDKAYVFEKHISDKNEVSVEMENLKEAPRKEVYKADITYGTNNEFGFDYLRDNMAQSLDQMVQRGHNFAIVDEVDSILIDEARTPLIISAPDAESTKLYETFAKIIPRLQEDVDYNIDEKMRAATLTDQGIEKVEKILGMDIYSEGGVRYAHQLEQALRANVLFKKDKDYVVNPSADGGEVVIVDDFTGRLMFGRRYSGGLHQAIEAKEGVRVQQESKTLATITFQNYFRMYKKLAGMTGTAATNAEEFSKVYNLEVAVIPPNRTMIRNDMPDRIYRTERGKFSAAISEIKERHKKGQPVLVGTVSIEKNELLSALLKKEGIPHNVLNAKNHEKEAQIIAEAGRRGAVTVATNMAGRGVDIVLGGKWESKSRQTASESVENPQREFSTPANRSLVPPRGDTVPARDLRVSEAALPTEKIKWQKEHDEVVALGGLHIIGTERHEARRIDNQLRGRSGRQGDPGSTHFFVSLEDDLMRVFGGDRIKKMMEVFNLPEDQPIEAKMVSRALESAQAKIEGFNFDIRKHVLEYDDVMNKQRETIYRKRKETLESENIKLEVLKIIQNEIQKITEFHTQEGYADNWNLKEVAEIMNSIMGLDDEQKNKIKKFQDKEELINYLNNLVEKKYEEKEKQIGEANMRAIEKAVMLRTIDMLWMEHLDNMEHLRDSVRLRAYGQRDPLVEYKNEGHRLFVQLLENIQTNVVGMIFKVEVSRNYTEQNAEPRGKPHPNPLFTKEREKGEAGRNDPCPCGSGKKYKRCHGR
jgi:preprotein translocase subunit SecA